MKLLTISVFIAAGFCASPAWGFSCRGFSEHNEIDVQGLIGEERLRRPCPEGVIDPKNPSIFFFESPGGLIDQIQAFTADFRKELEASFEISGVIPIVVVKNECESACIPVLSALNKMAAKGRIRLVVDPKTIIGFHGCSEHENGAAEDDEGVYSRVGTDRYLEYWQALGGNPDWIAQYSAFFATPQLTRMYPEDARLHGSQILDYAEISDAQAFRANIQL